MMPTNDDYDIIADAELVAGAYEQQGRAESDAALAAFSGILPLLPDQVVRGLRRALIEGWIDSSGSPHRAGDPYSSLMGVLEREMRRWQKDTLRRIGRLSVSLEGFMEDIRPGDTPDDSAALMDLMIALNEYVCESGIEV